jgi:glycosyltransferase involved in cell wall biosynthesis
MISIVITTYNRIHLVSGAINSALDFLGSPLSGEIIVVDDSSQDGTSSYLKEKYSSEIECGRITFIQHLHNRGVTAAKNTGASMAIHEWILFLDSDDKLIQKSSKAVFDTLLKTKESIPIVFFRCVDEKGLPIGSQIKQAIFPNLPDYIKYWTHGESLPLVRTQLFKNVAFREDLRGFEGLAYCKLIKHHGRAMISPLTVRIYETGGLDRLSTRKNLLKRGCLLAKGFMSILFDYRNDLPISTNLSIVVKIFINILRCIVGKFI